MLDVQGGQTGSLNVVGLASLVEQGIELQDTKYVVIPLCQGSSDEKHGEPEQISYHS